MHPFHLVDPSGLPFLLSLSALSVVLSAILYIHPTLSTFSGKIYLFGSLLITCILWVDGG